MNWIRNNMAVFVWFTAIAFVIWMFAIMGMGAFEGGLTQDPALATVNGVSIGYNNFQERVSQQRRQLAQELEGQPSGEQLQEIRQEVFRQMVRETLLQQQALSEGYEADQDQAETLLAMQIMGPEEFNPDRLDSLLAQLSDSRRQNLLEQTRRQLESMSQQQWLREQIPRRSLLEYQFAGGIREARVWGIYLNPREFIGEDEIQQYYDSYEDRFLTEPEARVREIFLGNPRDAENPEQSFQELEDTMEVINRELQGNTPFTELAREYNVDPELAEQGGDLGWIEPDDLPNQEARRVFDAEPGYHTSMVRSDEGFHYFYLEEGPDQERRPLQEVRGEIQDELLSDRHWQRAREEARDLHEQIRTNSDPLAALRELAPTNSHSPTAEQNGDYGWLPKRYLVLNRHSHAGSWADEIAEDQLIYPAVRRALFPEENGTGLREVAESESGFHLFYVEDQRSPDIESIPQETRQTWVNRLRQQHVRDYREAWLDWMQDRAEVNIELSREQIGFQLSLDELEETS